MKHSPLKSRRSFFAQGLDSIVDKALDAADLKQPLAFLGFDRSYVRMRREAMATNFEVIFGSYEKPKARETGMYALDVIDRYDSMLNIWSGHSELKDVNDRAAMEPVFISDELFEILKLAKEIYSETNGAFDISSTPLSRCWGFFNRNGRIPSPDDIQSALARVGMEHVELNEDAKSVFFRVQGMELTPASMGKGYALDQAMKTAHKYGLKDVLLNGGYSSVLASGAPAWKDAWQIDIRNPFDPDNPVAHLHIKNRGFSSSGNEEQFFFHKKKRLGHIIDPRSGQPVNEILSVSVTAPSALLAEALSTAFCVMGVEKTIEYCENRKDIGVLIIPAPNEKGESKIITSNFDEESLEVRLTSCRTKNQVTS